MNTAAPPSLSQALDWLGEGAIEAADGGKQTAHRIVWTMLARAQVQPDTARSGWVRSWLAWVRYQRATANGVRLAVGLAASGRKSRFIAPCLGRTREEFKAATGGSNS